MDETEELKTLRKERDILHNGYKSLAAQVSIFRSVFTGKYQEPNSTPIKSLLNSVFRCIDASFAVATLLNNKNEFYDPCIIGLDNKELNDKVIKWMEEIKTELESKRKPIKKDGEDIVKAFGSKNQISGVCVPMILDWQKQLIGIMCFFREANKPWTLHEANELRNIVSTAAITLIQSAPYLPNAPWIGAHNIAIMFADIRGFSPITDKLMDDKSIKYMDVPKGNPRNGQPVDVTDLLNEFFETIITEIKEEKRAWVDNLLGDGLIAFFDNDLEPNYEKEHGVIRAVCAALEMKKAYDKLFKKWEGEWIANFKRKYSIDVNLKLGIGIDYGTVLFDVFGSGSFYQHTAIGDHVNFAKRLESIAARPNEKGGDFESILISEPVYQRISKFINCKTYNPMSISGVYVLQRIYGILNWKNCGKEICKSEVKCKDCDA